MRGMDLRSGCAADIRSRQFLTHAAEAIRRQIGHLSLRVLDLQVSATLGGGHPGVAQQLLYRPQVGPGA